MMGFQQQQLVTFGRQWLQRASNEAASSEKLLLPTMRFHSSARGNGPQKSATWPVQLQGLLGYPLPAGHPGCVKTCAGVGRHDLQELLGRLFSSNTRPASLSHVRNKSCQLLPAESASTRKAALRVHLERPRANSSCSSGVNPLKAPLPQAWSMFARRLTAERALPRGSSSPTCKSRPHLRIPPPLLTLFRRYGTPLPQPLGQVPPVGGHELPLLARVRARLGVTPHALLALGHCASVFGVVALFMKDMLYLRMFMVCGSCCGVAFNLLQPTPLKIPAAWGLVFISLNFFQIGVLLHERRPVHFKNEEAEIYETVFQRHGVTPHQFEKLMRHAGATWHDLPAGHLILTEGDLVDTVCVVVRGRAIVSREGEVVGEVTQGNLIGETSLLAKCHQTGHTVTTSEPSRIVSWPRLKLGQVLMEDKSLLLSAAQMINSDLAVKLANSANLSSRVAILQTYEEVMAGICADGVIHPAEKRALREYRTRHHITTAQHLEAIAKCHWTPVEFEDGMKLDASSSGTAKFSIKKSINSFNENVAKVVSKAAHLGHRSKNLTPLDSTTPPQTESLSPPIHAQLSPPPAPESGAQAHQNTQITTGGDQ